MGGITSFEIIRVKSAPVPRARFEKPIVSCPKRKPIYDLQFREWITKKPCCVCHSRGVEHDDGSFRVHPSHMLTRGAGHGDYFNLLPMCIMHHQSFERSTSSERVSWYWLAYQLTREFINETNPERWKEIKE